MTTMNLLRKATIRFKSKPPTSLSLRISHSASKNTMQVRICCLSRFWRPRAAKVNSRSSSTRMRGLTSKNFSLAKWTHRRSRT